VKLGKGSRAGQGLIFPLARCSISGVAGTAGVAVPVTPRLAAAGRVPDGAVHRGAGRRVSPHHSVLGIAWTAITAAVMFGLAAGKACTDAALDNPVLKAEGRVAFIDGVLAAAVLLGLMLTSRLAGGGPTRSAAT